MRGNNIIENLESIVTIMSGEKILLQYADDRAYVQLQKVPIIVNIPKESTVVNKTAQYPKNAEKINLAEMAMALGYKDNIPAFDFWVRRMLLYHEMGHILFTDREFHHGKDSCLKLIINFLEDARIETQMGKEYSPMADKFEILNQIFLVQNEVAFLESPSTEKTEVARKSAFLASMYYYGLIEGTPTTDLVKEYFKAEQTFRVKKKDFKHVVTESKRLFDLTPGDDEQINAEMKYIISNKSSGQGGMSGGTNGKISDKLKELMKNQIKNNPSLQKNLSKEIVGTDKKIKAWGMEMAHKDTRNARTLSYVDNMLEIYLYETLKRIIGGQASKKDNFDIEGHSLDMEAYMEWEKNPNQDIKMFLTANKREKPDMYLNICVDASGSMGGDKIEVAKKTGINLSLACERVGIKTAFLKFETESEIIKAYNRYTIESPIGELNGGGGTDISSSVKICREMMMMLPHHDKKAIILISDGEDGSAAKVAEYLKEIPNVRYYMVGIASNVDGYVSSLEKLGAKVSGKANIRDSSELSRVLIQFSKDFVRTCH